MTDQPLSESKLHTVFDEIGRGLSDRVLLSPGDDMAMIGLDSSSRVLAAADQVVLGRHARMDEDPHAIGRKAVLRNLSDVAAMAAKPIATIATATAILSIVANPAVAQNQSDSLSPLVTGGVPFRVVMELVDWDGDDLPGIHSAAYATLGAAEAAARGGPGAERRPG